MKLHFIFWNGSWQVCCISGSENHHLKLQQQWMPLDVLPPMIMFQGKTLLKDIYPCGFMVCVQEKPWLTLWWLKGFVSYQWLIVNSFCSHLIDKVKKKWEKQQSLKLLSQGAVCSDNQFFKNVINTMWINCIRDEGKKVQFSLLDWTALPAKQLIVNWIAAGLHQR